MSKRFPPSRFVLPEVVNPPDSICFQVPVPNDRKHIAAFKGAIFQLAKAYSWQNDDAHTAKAVAAVWLDIFNELERCKPAAAQISIGTDGNEDFMIRQNPTKPCILESSVDGITWCQWADLSLCQNLPSQPGAGGTLEPNGCVKYTVVLQGNGQWKIPVPITAGTTIKITNPSGGWSRGPGFDWQCPNGWTYLLGQCVPASGSPGGSGYPFPAAIGGAVVLKIGTDWYEAYDDTYSFKTVVAPSGISPSEAFFQMNDNDINDNFGSISFDLEVCATPVVMWSHTFTGEALHTTFNIYGVYATWDGAKYIGEFDGSATYLYIETNLPAGHYTGINLDLLPNIVGSLVRIYSGTPALTGTLLFDSPGRPAPYNFDLVNPGSVLIAVNFPGSVSISCSTVTLSGIGADPFA